MNFDLLSEYYHSKRCISVSADVSAPDLQSLKVTGEKKALTTVLNAETCMQFNLITATKYDTVDGFPGGCLNANSGLVGCVQYSSSHSAGRSTS